ncbi:hypothetical protein QBC45DRAFT_340569, partial [Copromyces sp. CBS 386.78]
PLGHLENGTVRVYSQSGNFFKSHANAHLNCSAAESLNRPIVSNEDELPFYTSRLGTVPSRAFNTCIRRLMRAIHHQPNCLGRMLGSRQEDLLCGCLRAFWASWTSPHVRYYRGGITKQCPVSPH